MPPKKVHEEEDPEAIALRKFRAVCRFRSIARSVMNNLKWLQKYFVETNEIRQRIRNVLESDASILSLKDVALLNKNIPDRTAMEKKYLFKKIGEFSMFKKYPAEVRRALAAVCFFKYWPPGRVIIRERHEPYAMYYIISGSVVVSKCKFDEFYDTEVQIESEVLGEGRTFGDVEVLHNVKRDATYITTKHCEFIAITREHFANIIMNTVAPTWDAILGYLSMFSYFKDYDKVSLREGCVIAKIIHFKRNDVVYGLEDTSQSHAYFLISGQCQVIECMDIIVRYFMGRELYSLVARSQEIIRKTSAEEFVEMAIRGTPSQYSLKKCSTESTLSRKSTVKFGMYASPMYSSEQSFDSKPSSVTLAHVKPIIRKIFMQVCLYNSGATFGFGENMRNRTVVAKTDGILMMLPRCWLMERNTANIWNRVVNYLKRTLPSTEKLFKCFVEQRNWEGYQASVVNEVVERSKSVNFTSIHDVPFYIRINEVLHL